MSTRIDWDALRERLAAVERRLESTAASDEERRQQMLRQRARYLAGRTPDVTITELRPMMVFRLGDERYAVALAQLRLVTTLEDLIPVPGAPDGILGLLGVDGEVCTIWDLAGLLDLPRAAPPAGGHALLLRADAGRGLRADYVEGRLDVDPRRLLPAEAADGTRSAPFLEAVTADRVHVLDVEALLANLRSEDRKPPAVQDDSTRRI
jgi:purine-binding chemotaxis protein CheW